MSRRRAGLRQMDEQSEARPHHPQLKKKGMKWNGWHAFRRGLATNLHEMGVPTKVIQRVCRHADEATTKKHYIHATEPGVRRGMRKLEASITREKNERR
jgi:integrase